MPDERYTAPVAGLGADKLAARLRDAIAKVEGTFPPNTGVCVFVFDFKDGGGLGYIANAEREGVIDTLREWIARQERGF